MRYRPEIDGLRAIAVIPVIFYHAGFKFASGGYIGVDVFFVISGYLITSIIHNEIENGEFSLARFYERRARRILPALYLVVLITSIFAWFWLIPRDFKAFSKSVAAVSIFLSNIQFTHELGYFDTAADLKPLLHTWSLAVEEQYYAIFPLLLIFLYKFGKRIAISSLVILCISSFVYTEWKVHDNYGTSYYLLSTRGWEILLGAFLAFHNENKSHHRTPAILNQLMSILGLVLIIYASVHYTRDLPYPSYYTLIPTVGSALIILYARNGTLAEYILSNRILVGIGLLSYSAYLWHQPLFAFAKYISVAKPSLTLMISLTTISFVLAFITWKYIETPIRNKNLCSKRCILHFSIYGSVTLFIVSLLFINNVFKPRSKLSNTNILADITQNNLLKGIPCNDFKALQGDATCKYYGEGSNLIVIWGDSHANALSRAVPDNILQKNMKLMVIAHDGCPPIAGVVINNTNPPSLNCSSIKTLASYAKYIKSKNPKVVILTGRWTMYLHGYHKLGALMKSPNYLSLREHTQYSPKESKNALEYGLINTLNIFSDSKLYVLGQAPDLHFMKDRAIYFGKTVDRKKIDAWHASEQKVFTSINRPNYKYINTRNYFCNNLTCTLRIDNQPIYYDDNHLKGLGLDRIWKIIRNKILSQKNY